MATKNFQSYENGPIFFSIKFTYIGYEMNNKNTRKY